MAKSRDTRLTALVGVLIEGWGADKVRQALDEAGSGPAKPVRVGSQGKGSEAKKKPNAVEQAAKLLPSDPRKTLIAQLAELFDRRELMPSVADVRSFLELRGFSAGSIKDRSDGFRAILRVMTVMSDDRLEKFARDSLRATPSKLGPLSEAIADTAAQRTARRPDDDPKSSESEPQS